MDKCIEYNNMLEYIGSSHANWLRVDTASVLSNLFFATLFHNLILLAASIAEELSEITGVHLV